MPLQMNATGDGNVTQGGCWNRDPYAPWPSGQRLQPSAPELRCRVAACATPGTRNHKSIGQTLRTGGSGHCSSAGARTPQHPDTTLMRDFVVRRGSIGKAEVGKGIHSHSFAGLCEELLQQQKIPLKDGALVFEQDGLFTSPSGASAVVCGNACSDWPDWNDGRGATPHELKRHAEVAATYHTLRQVA